MIQILQQANGAKRKLFGSQHESVTKKVKTSDVNSTQQQGHQSEQQEPESRSQSPTAEVSADSTPTRSAAKTAKKRIHEWVASLEQSKRPKNQQVGASCLISFNCFECHFWANFKLVS